MSSTDPLKIRLRSIVFLRPKSPLHEFIRSPMIAEDFLLGARVGGAAAGAESRSLTVLCDQRPIRDRKAALGPTVEVTGTTERHQY